MKKDIHPAYGPVALRHSWGDRSADLLVLTRSTLVGRQDAPTVELDGATYPVVDVDVSSARHPFWTGRVQAFERRYGEGKR